MTDLRIPSATLLAISRAVAGDIVPPAGPSGGAWEFSFSAGPAFRNLGDLKINSGYRSGGFALPAFVGPGSFTAPPVGDGGSYADRQYNDGYVRQDEGTANDGSTWYWGYDSASQIQGDQLVYSATGFQSIAGGGNAAPNAGPASKDSLRGAAPHLQFDALSPARLGPFRIGFSAGLDFMKVDQSLLFSNFSGTQTLDHYRLDYVDRYDLDGVIPPLAPYQGSFAGPGPLIGNLPADRTITPVLLSTDTASFSNSVASSIDINALSVTVGPTLALDQGPFSFALSGGLIVNVYDWSTRQAEVLNVTTASGGARVTSWAEGNSDVTVRPGIYLQADAAYALRDDIALGGFLRFDAAPEFRAEAGPTIYKIDPYGVTAGVQIRFAFP